MSLRERLQQEKAAKAEVEEEQVASSKEQEQAGLKQQLDDLVARRTAIAGVKEAAAKASEDMQRAKASLKAERGNLRALHEESKDEDTGEASLPKPAELVRGEEYKGEEEIQSYNKAREAFKLGAEQVKAVESQLAELGIENPSELLPGQLEATLEEREKELNEEARAFVLEHPGANPEFAAEVREEIVSEKQKALISEDRDSLNSALYHSLIDESGRSTSTRGLSFEVGLGGALEKMTKNSEYRERYVKQLFALHKAGVDGVSDMDTEALSRAIAQQMTREGMMSDVTAKDFRRAFLREEQKTGESLDIHSEDGNEATEKVEALAESRAVADPRLKKVAEQIIGEYKATAEYQEIPRQIEALRQRGAEIEKRLATPRNSGQYPEEGSLVKKNESLKRQEENLRSEKSRIEIEIQQLKGMPSKVLALNTLPAEILDSPMEIKGASYGKELNVVVQGMPQLPSDVTSYSENEKNTEILKSLNQKIENIEGMKDGVFGPSNEKKEELLRLKSQMDNLGVGNAGVKEAKAEVVRIETAITERAATLAEVDRKQKEFKQQIGPIRESAALLGGEEFKGTVREFIQALRDKVATDLPELEARLVAIAGEEGEIRSKKAESLKEAASLEEEQQTIGAEQKELTERQARLRKELQQAGYAVDERRGH